MLVVTRPGVTDDQLDAIRELIEAGGLRTYVSRAGPRRLIGCVGDPSRLDQDLVRRGPGVESVAPPARPYQLAAAEFAGARTVVRVGASAGAAVGSRQLAIIAGPCSVEGREMLLRTALAVQQAGAGLLRGGAYKPRTSPYAFQGLGAEALELLAEARCRTGLPVVTEVLDPRHLEPVMAVADVLQVGARNMQNYALLQELGRLRRPVLLKRGWSATVSELLGAAEYLLAGGNDEVILCERGIRSFETATRNTLDVGAISLLQRETHLPVIADPSHAAGRADLVRPLACAAVAAGADGLLIEVHPRPHEARSDGEQSLDPDAFRALMGSVARFAGAAGRTVAGPA